jgi:N-methylhydantoinase A
VRLTGSRKVGGRPIQLPMVDVHTVGAGGGSIGWRDSGGALRVGPQSAGSAPGPACYGRGGAEPTVTDANILLGYLGPESTLAGGVALDVDAAERAVSELAASLDLPVAEAAEGIVRVANAEMARALRVVTVERGVDPRDFALMPFGGAGPMHAAAVAAELGMNRLLCPRAGGVLSALGLCASERRRDTTRTVLLDLGETDAERIRAEVAELREALGGAGGQVEERIVCELRYRGQAFELPVPGGDLEPGDLTERFAAAHEERFGFRDPDARVELVNLRLTLAHPAAEPRPRAADAGAELAETRRTARFAGEDLEARVIRGEPPRGMTAEGPVIFELPETTLVLPPDWSATVDEAGTIAAERA